MWPQGALNSFKVTVVIWLISVQHHVHQRAIWIELLSGPSQIKAVYQFLLQKMSQNILWCHFFRWRYFFCFFVFVFSLLWTGPLLTVGLTKQNRVKPPQAEIGIFFYNCLYFQRHGEDSWSLIIFCCSFLHEQRWTTALHFHLFHKIVAKISWTWVLLLNSVL